MRNSSLTRTADSAVGPLAGYLFQFEKALLSLSELVSPAEFVSIEEVDDVSTHTQDGTVLLTVQLKHSISNSGSTFQDTSTALWRTIEIWLEKIESGTFNNETKFICATNKQIPKTSLIYKIVNLPFDKAIEEMEQLLNTQQAKLKEVVKLNPKAGGSIKETIRLIKLALKKGDSLEIIKNNLSISDNESIKQRFLNQLHVDADQVSDLQRENIYEAFYGWITATSKSRWMNGQHARLTKKDFDNKWYQVSHNSSIVNAIFRTKESLGSISEYEILKKKKELFVRQIEDIDRRKDAKARIIKDAILNFIYTDIELKHVIDKGDYREVDFKEFLAHCCATWQNTFDNKVIKESSDYSDQEKNDLAIDIFDGIMNEVKLEFKNGFCFTIDNEYVKKGCFLQLSNEPRIGWHPEWEKKYKFNEGQ